MILIDSQCCKIYFGKIAEFLKNEGVLLRGNLSSEERQEIFGVVAIEWNKDPWMYWGIRQDEDRVIHLLRVEYRGKKNPMWMMVVPDERDNEYASRVWNFVVGGIL